MRVVTGAGLPVVEVHVDNPAAREAFRGGSVLAPVATGVIAGLGTDAYLLALDWMRRHGFRGNAVGEDPPGAG